MKEKDKMTVFEKMQQRMEKIVGNVRIGGKVGKGHRKGFWAVDNVMSLNVNVGYMGSFCL